MSNVFLMRPLPRIEQEKMMAAFRKAMQSYQYGHDERMQALAWYETGWKARHYAGLETAALELPKVK